MIYLKRKQFGTLYELYKLNNNVLKTIDYGILSKSITSIFSIEQLSMLTRYSEQQYISALQFYPQKLDLFKDYLDELKQKYQFAEEEIISFAKKLNDIDTRTLDELISQNEDTNVYEKVYRILYYEKAQRIAELPEENKERIFFEKFGLPLNEGVKLSNMYGDGIDKLLRNNDDKNARFIKSIKDFLDGTLQEEHNYTIEEMSCEDLVCINEEVRKLYAKEYLKVISAIPSNRTQITNSHIAQLLEGADVREYEGEFSLLTTMVGAFSGEKSDAQNAILDWNRHTEVQNHCLNASYSTNTNNSTIRKFKKGEYRTIYSLDSSQMQPEHFSYMAPYDLYSNARYYLERTQRMPKYYIPDEMVDNSRYLYTDFMIERGVKPNAVIIYDIDNPLNDNDDFKRYVSQQRIIAEKWNIPICIIDRDKIAQKELGKIQKEMQELEKDLTSQRIEAVLTHFLNCRNGCVTNDIEQDPIGSEIEKKYFSSEKFDDVFKKILSNIKKNGNQDRNNAYSCLMKMIEVIHNEEEKSLVIRDSYDRYNPCFNGNVLYSRLYDVYSSLGETDKKKEDIGSEI